MKSQLGPQDLLIDFSINNEMPSSLSILQQTEDLDFLVYALERAYPGQWSMPKSDWERVLSKLRNLRTTELTIEQFGTDLADTLWEIPDGHLKVKNGGKPFGLKIAEHLRPQTTGMNLSEKGIWNCETRQVDGLTVAILSISGFPPSSDPVWNGFFEALTKAKTANAVIVDLRGNCGGDDTKAIEMTSAFLGRALKLDWVREIICDSAESNALQINTYRKIVKTNYESRNKAVPRELTDELIKLERRMRGLSLQSQESKVVRVSDSIEFREAGDPFTGKIFVLIDSHTVSSGEWATLYLQHHPKTTLVGQNTYGMIHFGNSGLLRLPHSSLEITLCMKLNELEDQRFFEKTGIPADVSVANEDSLDFVLTHLRQ